MKHDHIKSITRKVISIRLAVLCGSTAATKPYFDSPQKILQANYYTEGVAPATWNQTALMLRSRARRQCRGRPLPRVVSGAPSEGMIDFNSDWRCDGPARILSSSYYALHQEELADDEEGIGYLDCSRKFGGSCAGQDVISRPGRRRDPRWQISSQPCEGSSRFLLLIRDRDFYQPSTSLNSSSPDGQRR